MEQLIQTPAVHVRRRSVWHPGAVDASISRAIAASRGVPRTMPVLHQGEAIGLVTGDKRGAVSRFAPITYRQWCGFTNYADLKSAAKGQGVRFFFDKDTSQQNQSCRWIDSWPCGGLPAAGGYAGAANTAVQFNNTTTGAFRIDGKTPSGGQTRHPVSWEMVGILNSGQSVKSGFLYDRVLTYEAATISTSLQTMTNTLAAQRYISAGQEGLLIIATSQTALGATASALSAMNITDNSGNTAVALAAGYTMSWWATAFATDPTAGAFICCPNDNTNNFTISPFLPLPGNVSGVRKIEDYTSSVNNTGTVCFVLGHPICPIWLTNSGSTRVEMSRIMFTLERVYDDACLSFLLHQDTNSTGTTRGNINLVHA